MKLVTGLVQLCILGGEVTRQLLVAVYADGAVGEMNIAFGQHIAAKLLQLDVIGTEPALILLYLHIATIQNFAVTSGIQHLGGDGNRRVGIPLSGVHPQRNMAETTTEVKRWMEFFCGGHSRCLSLGQARDKQQGKADNPYSHGLMLAFLVWRHRPRRLVELLVSLLYGNGL
jgi:hypothetical protein